MKYVKNLSFNLNCVSIILPAMEVNRCEQVSEVD